MKRCSHCHKVLPIANFREGGEWYKQCATCREKSRVYESTRRFGYVLPKMDSRYVREVDSPERQRRIALYASMISRGVPIEYETNPYTDSASPTSGITEMETIQLAMIGGTYESER